MSQKETPGLKKEHEKYTSTGLTRVASKALNEMSEDLHMNKREVATVAILAFQKSPEYQKIVAEIHEIVALRDKYPGLFRTGGLLRE